MRLDLRALVEEINALEAEIKEKGLTREEHALLVVTQSYLEELPEKELIEWIKGLNGALDDSRIIFKGWTQKSETRRNVRRTVFSSIHKTFKDTVESEKIIDLTYDLMDYIERFRSGD